MPLAPASAGCRGWRSRPRILSTRSWARGSLEAASRDSFGRHPLENFSRRRRALARVKKSASPAPTRPLREFWEPTDLSGAEFADELSDYFALPRLSLPQLLTTPPRLDGFSRR